MIRVTARAGTTASRPSEESWPFAAVKHVLDKIQHVISTEKNASRKSRPRANPPVRLG
jgi:hypothetical protein